MYMEYCDFYEFKEIGSGGYGTVYTAKYKKYLEVECMEETVVLKRFKEFWWDAGIIYFRSLAYLLILKNWFLSNAFALFQICCSWSDT